MFIALANAFKVLEVPNIGNPTGYISVGLPPQQRYKASIASSSSQIFIYGGYPLKHNEIWYYDLSTSMWGHFITGYPSMCK